MGVTAIICSGCQARLNVPADEPGKSFRCPRCKAVVSLATPASPPNNANTRDYSNPNDESQPNLGDPDIVDAKTFLRPAEMPDELGRLGHFRILEELGRGGMGVVYRAEDLNLLRPIALKVMLPQYAAKPQAKDRFLREARTAGSIDNDHIITIHEVGEDNGVPFLSMPVLKGESLSARLKRDGRLTLPEMLRLAWEMCDGLQAAHERNLVHRDLKPGNIWLEGARRRVKILDFGLARPLDTGEHLTRTGVVLGTPSYMAPEQARDPNVDCRADLFSLGVILYQMTTGKLPFVGHDMLSMLYAVCHDEPPPPAKETPGMPVELDALILKLLAKDPAKRFQTASEVSSALTAINMKSFGGNAIVMNEPNAIVAGVPIAKPVSPATISANLPAGSTDPFSFKDAKGKLTPVSSAEGVGPSLGARARTSEPRRPLRFKWIAVGFVGLVAVLLAWQVVIRISHPDDRETKLEGNDAKNEPRKKDDPQVGDGSEPDAALAPFDAAQAKKHQNEWAAYLKQPVVQKSQIGMEMVLIPPAGGKVLGKPWRIGKYEVTQGQFTRVMGFNPSWFQGKKAKETDSKSLPVEYVRWFVAVEFCNELSKLEKLEPYYAIKVDKREGDEITEAEVKILGGEGYRLPTEREWEFACRAGTATRYWNGDLEEDLDNVGWYQKNSDDRSHKVGEKLANAFGLFDVHGNASEWCWDPGECVLRGAGWNVAAGHCVVWARSRQAPWVRCPNFGLRVARGSLQPEDVGKQFGDIPINPKKNDDPPVGAVSEPEAALAPFNAVQAKKHQDEWAAYLKQPVVQKSRTGMEMVLIPPAGGKELGQPWRIGKYEVTQAQFTRVMGFNPSFCQGENAKGADPKSLPVEHVRWFVAVEFCNELSKLEKMKPYYEIKIGKREGEEITEAEVTILGGDGYRLPTEREWEYACRAGTITRYWNSEREEDLDHVGWYQKNSDGRPHKVGEKLANAFGLHDMHGNVNEWCWELHHPPDTARVLRGGGWNLAADSCEVGRRLISPPASRYTVNGLRVARGPVEDAGQQVGEIPLKPKKNENPPGVAVTEPEAALVPFNATQAKKHQDEWAAYLKQPVVQKSKIGMEMVLIPPAGGKDLGQPWRIGKYEVTQGQFARVMGFNPSRFQGENAKGADWKSLPVEQVRWFVAVEFCNELSKLEKLKPYYEIKIDKREGEEITEAEVKILGGDGYRLPTEREWEYACRAGTTMRHWNSNREEDLDWVAWYQKNSDGRSHQVGEKLANAFGLYDVHGNAMEWCWDLHDPGAVSRVIRGGGWGYGAGDCTVFTRNKCHPAGRDNGNGLRVARSPQ